ncbi:hypothetical protein LPTSP3_g10040 [Leptospira kobayashii]|uniref:Uncharacterized protein n=1 Tax=Leptospira kobayashii TaxID=1917830 RepID=A0ABM7UHD4_9LEPT|nr:hypothetical protein [Leptospira kobayashii]BDA78074.1 hypothetical protein LPTSP3_g10040 [Leptospira kobayashii]
MKILHKLIKFGKDLKLKIQSRQIEVSFYSDSVLFTEKDLKKRFAEGWDEFSEKNLFHFTSFDWKTHPQPLGKSQIELYGIRKLDSFSKFHYLLFPNHYIDRQKTHLKEKTNLFLEIPRKTFENRKSIKDKIRNLFHTPKKILWKEISFIKYEIPKSETHSIPDTDFLPILKEGQMTLVVKWGKLVQISYLWKLRTFERPFPLVGEIFLKSRRKFGDGSFGESCFVSLGYFLPNEKDNYFLSYWGLTPVTKKEWQQYAIFQNLSETEDLDFYGLTGDIWFGQILFSRGIKSKKKKNLIFALEASEVCNSDYERIFLESTWELF